MSTHARLLLDEPPRLAVIAAFSASRELKDEDAPTASLLTIPIWPTTDGRIVSTKVLADYARRTGVLCMGPAAGGAAVDGRPVVVVEHAQAASAILGGVPLVSYGEYLAWSTASLEQEAERHPLVSWFEDDGVRGFVAPGSGHMVFHAGRFLGRFPRADDGLLVVDDPFASSDHAVLTFRGRAWYVEDLESTNGSYVNGVPVERVAPLGFGDELQVGEVRFRLDRGRE